jgi:tetratricopeptide (TPR) repeat protein
MRTGSRLDLRAPCFLLAMALAWLPARLPAEGLASPGSLFSQGEGLFREDKPREAAPILEKAILEPQVDERAWLYLAACYEELGRYDDAVNVLRKGSVQAVRLRHLFFYNMGNEFVLLGKNSFAEEMYGQALAANASFAPAYLNRANVRILLQNYPGASQDYTSYLTLAPDTPQRANIEALLAKLQGDLATAKAQAEAAAAAAAAAEAAKQALLTQVQADLMASAEEATSLSSGAGQVQSYGDDLGLDE